MHTHIQLSTGRVIGPGHPTYIIAEIGSNHDGSLETAKRLIDSAKLAGADAVKLQSFQVGELINRRWKPEGQWEPHKAWDVLERLTVPEEWHQELQAYCCHVGIDFLSAPFDPQRLTLLAQLRVPMIKIASGDLTHHSLLREVGALKIPVILSTGLAYLGEVEAALNVLQGAGCQDVALLHCVSLYPPRFEDANIRAMVTMQQAFKLPVGYSDHTPGSVVPLGAVALGASFLEKHLTYDKTASGPDHPYALDVPEFTAMVTQIRQLEAALGSGIKQPVAAEIPERIGARRAVYAKRPISKGEHISADMIKIVRHAYPEGIGADDADRVIGRTAADDIDEDSLLTWETLLP